MENILKTARASFKKMPNPGANDSFEDLKSLTERDAGWKQNSLNQREVIKII